MCTGGTGARGSDGDGDSDGARGVRGNERLSKTAMEQESESERETETERRVRVRQGLQTEFNELGLQAQKSSSLNSISGLRRHARATSAAGKIGKSSTIYSIL